MTKPEDISQAIWDKAEIVAKEATRDAMRDPLMPYYITVAPHIARAILSAVEEEREACADVARNWLHNWANDLVDTRDSYIEAKSTGKHNGRRMGREDADFYAKQFRERADAVSDCVEHVASAIRNRKES